MESPEQSIWHTTDAQQMTQLIIMTANTNTGSARYQFSALEIVTHSCVMISPCEGTTTIMPGLQKRNRRKVNNLFKVTQPVSGRAGVQIQAALTFTSTASPSVIMRVAEESQVLRKKKPRILFVQQTFTEGVIWARCQAKH